MKYNLNFNILQIIQNFEIDYKVSNFLIEISKFKTIKNRDVFI